MHPWRRFRYESPLMLESDGFKIGSCAHSLSKHVQCFHLSFASQYASRLPSFFHLIRLQIIIPMGGSGKCQKKCEIWIERIGAEEIPCFY